MLLKNLKIVPIVGNIIEDGYIHIQGDKITSVGDMIKLTISDNDERDLTGLTAYPGFIDGHCHIGLFGDGIAFEGDDGNEDTDPNTPHLRAVDAVNAQDGCFKEALAHGITTVITGPGSANAISGQFCAIKTMGKRVDDMLIKAPVAMKMSLGENPKVTYHSKTQAPTTRMAIAAIIREQLIKTQRYMQDIENAKDDEDTEEPEFDAKCEALIPLLKREIKAHIHAHRADDICTAIRLCKEFNLDGVIVHGTEGHLIADIIAQEKINVISGPIIASRSKPELAKLDVRCAGIMEKAGVKVSICTDHPEVPIQYLNISAGVAVREGMSYQKALEGITILPAIQAGISNRVGSIEVGKDADIVIFEGNPLSLEAKPRLVIVSGRIAD